MQKKSQVQLPLILSVSAASLLALSLLACPSAGFAQSADEVRAKLQEAIARRDKARASLESNRKYLNENRERAGTIKQEMARLVKERAKLDADLIRSGEKVKQTKAKMKAIEDRLGRLETLEQSLRNSLNAQHRSIGRLLSAIQRMGRNPPPEMITRRSDALAMVRSAMLLARAFPKLRGEALTLSRQLNRLVALMSDIRTESDRLRREAKTLKDAQTRVSYLMQTKRKSLGDRKVELAEVRRTVKVIGGTVDNLDDLIGKLGPAIDRNTRLGRELVAEARRKRKLAFLAEQEKKRLAEEAGKHDSAQSVKPGTLATADKPLPDLPILKSKFWQFAQKEFGEWTEQRLAELAEQDNSKEEANKYLVASFMKFRRNNAEYALLASPDSLEDVAAAFVDSLRALTTKGAKACYAYISNGETTPEIAQYYFEPSIAPKLEAQMLAIMKAIADGKSSPTKTRTEPTSGDFNKLSAELGKRGWSAADLKLFSDPIALSKAKPKLVCRLITEWFATQTTLGDRAIRDQLIAASLRPVIGG